MWDNSSSALNKEANTMEFVWTLVPSLLVIGLCYLNLQCLGHKVYHKIARVVKIVGNQ